MSKKNVLVCSAIRNSGPMLDFFLSQIKETANRSSDKFTFHISLYENDSEDNTKYILEKFNWPKELFGNIVINMEDLGAKKFGSVISKERIDVIASARNNCLDQFDDLNKMDYVVYADSDYAWSDDVLSKILEEMESEDRDIVSGYSLHADIGRPHMELYDKWATRAKDVDIWWNCTPYVMLKDKVEVYSTFNGLSAFKSKPFIDGLRFSSKSRLNEEDVEHISICEGFREAGLNNIIMLKKAHLLHFMDCNNFRPWLEHQAKAVKNG